MYHVWDGSQWNKLNALKVWNGSAWVKTPKFKVRTSISWLPTSVSDKDVSQLIKWSVEGPTPPPPPTVTHPVPDLNLKTIEEVNTILTPLNFGYNITGYEVTSNLSYDNKVVIDSQIPAKDAILTEGSDVAIKLYNFVQPQALVPNLNGMLTSVANDAIIAAGFVIGTPLTPVQTYNTNLIGRVVANSQYPAADELMDTGTSIVYDYYEQAPYTTVPNITGLDEADIYQVLSDANLTIGTRTTYETTDTNLEGTVKSQFPLNGTQAEFDSPVNYVAYIANTTTPVPNMIGLTQTQANDLLTLNELYLGTVTNIETTVPANEGKVAIQQYAPGTIRPVNTTVNLTVYVPNTTIAVPNVVGMNIFDLTTFLEPYELYAGLDTNYVETTDTNLHYKVKSQTPLAGTNAPIWSTVTVVFYMPLQRTVPNLVGLTPQPYGTAIGTDGFTWGNNVLNNTATTDSALVGKVATQSPQAGQQYSPSLISYGIYYDNRPIVPTIAGSTEATAKTAITNAGLNYSISYQALPSAGYATVGTVKSGSISPAEGTRVVPGTTVSFTVWTAYVAQPVTRTGTVYIGWGGDIAAEWIAGYKLTATTGTRRSTSAPFYYGYYDATNAKNHIAWTFDWTAFTNRCNVVSGGASWSIQSVVFRFWANDGVGTTAAKSLRLGSYPSDVSSSPSTMPESSVNLRNQTLSLSGRNTYGYATLNSTLVSDCFTAPNYPLVIYAPNTSIDNYGSNDSDLQYTVTIQWTEYV